MNNSEENEGIKLNNHDQIIKKPEFHFSGFRRLWPWTTTGGFLVKAAYVAGTGCGNDGGDHQRAQ